MEVITRKGSKFHHATAKTKPADVEEIWIYGKPDKGDSALWDSVVAPAVEALDPNLVHRVFAPDVDAEPEA